MRQKKGSCVSSELFLLATQHRLHLAKGFVVQCRWAQAPWTSPGLPGVDFRCTAGAHEPHTRGSGHLTCEGVQMHRGSCSLRPSPLDPCTRCCTVAPAGVLKAWGTQHPCRYALLRTRAALPSHWAECAWARLGHTEHRVPGAPLLAEQRSARAVRGKQVRGQGPPALWVPPAGDPGGWGLSGGHPSGPWETGTREQEASKSDASQISA